MKGGLKMPQKFRMEKVKEYPRPHNANHSWFHGIESVVVDRAVNYPIMFQDEGKGAPSGYNSHPEHASFVATDEPNVYPDSRVDIILAELRFSLTKAFFATDSLVALRVAYMPYFLAFLDDYIAVDELSTNTVKGVLKLQTETTDRQGWPDFNLVKTTPRYAGSNLMPASVPDLTTNQQLECIAFNPETYYDMLHYMTNSGKLKACQGGLKWLTLTKRKPIARILIKLRGKVKRANPYMTFGCMTYVPEADTEYQIHVASETTNVSHVSVSWNTRFNEWNHGFDHDRI